MSPVSTDSAVAAHLQRCARKDPSGLQALINTYGPLLQRYAGGLFEQPHADQLTQDGFALIWQHANLYRPEQGSALGWMMSIFRYRLAQALDSTRYERAQALGLDSLLRQLDARDPFANAVLGLTQEQQKLLVGRYLFAWNIELCVLHTGISEPDVDNQIWQACHHLALRFSPWQINDTHWQTENGQACIESLRPHNNISALLQRRQKDPKALKDTLRWEMLCAGLCHLLPAATENTQWVSALSARLGVQLLPNLPAVPQRAANQTIAQPTDIKDWEKPITVKSGTDSTPIPANMLKKEASRTQSEYSPKKPEQSEKPEQAGKSSKSATHEQNSTVDNEHDNESESQLQRRQTFYWKFFSLVNLLLVIGLVTWMFLPKPPPIEIIQMAPRLGAVLQAPGHSATPGWVLSVDPQQQVLLTPVVPTQLKGNEQVHLWTRAADDSELRSLGLINPNQPVTLTKDVLETVQEGQLFEMTLESSDQPNPSEPQGPILFMGRVVSLGDYEPKDTTPPQQ